MTYQSPGSNIQGANEPVCPAGQSGTPAGVVAPRPRRVGIARSEPDRAASVILECSNILTDDVSYVI